MPRQQRSHKATIIVVIVIAIIAIACFAAWRIIGAQHVAGYAVLHIYDSEDVALPLDKDAEYAVSTEKGDNLVVVKDGAVCVREANCPNQDCINMGWVSQVGEQIICLPHELLIEVSETADGTSGSAGLDAVAQ